MVDAAVVDAATVDAAVVDASVADAGVVDAGVADAPLADARLPGDAGEDPDDGEGCDCQTSSSPPLWLLAVVGLALRRRQVRP